MKQGTEWVEPGYIVGVAHADGGDWETLGGFCTFHAARAFLKTLPKPDGKWIYEIHGRDGSGRVDEDRP